MNFKVQKLPVLLWLCLCISVAVPVSAQNKYSRYIKVNSSNLFQLCVSSGDNIACYLYGALQKKRGNLTDAHNAFFLGA